MHVYNEVGKELITENRGYNGEETKRPQLRRGVGVGRMRLSPKPVKRLWFLDFE
jgi:hypothetical protein